MIHHQDDTVQLHHGDCLDVLQTLPDCSVDAVICDPPYGLANTTPAQVAETITAWVSGDREHLPTGKGFMGKSWDAFVPPVAVWDECLRVLKPGGHALVFAGSRTHDLMTLGLRLAGFDIRDTISWLYGSGMPKSHDISKALDRAAGASREDKFGGSFERRSGPTGNKKCDTCGKWLVSGSPCQCPRPQDLPQSPAAQQWAGWGSGMKPAHEPIVVARKPLGGTLAANVLQWGTGGLNIDGTRVGSGGQLKWEKPRDMGYHGGTDSGPVAAIESTAGRWPTNVVLDDTAAEALDAGEGGRSINRPTVWRSPGAGSPGDVTYGAGIGAREEGDVRSGFGDSGGPSRFFPVFKYQAKAPTRERVSYVKEGDSDTWAKSGFRKRCAKCGKQEINVPGSMCACPEPDFQPDPSMQGKVAHPTVKPLELMRWLCRLVTPPGGTILEPFAGSGTTVEAAVLEGFRCIAVERETDYLPLIMARLERARPEPLASDVSEDAPALFDKPQGRWPTNVVLSRSAAAEVDAQSGITKSPGTYERSTEVVNNVFGASSARPMQYGHGDSGGASRFFPVFEDVPLFDESGDVAR